MKQFILYIGEKEKENTDWEIDMSVYGKNKNFKMPYQTKIGSIRVQRPINATYKDHMIGRYKSDHFEGHFEVVLCKNETLPTKKENNIIKDLNETKYKNI